MFPELFTVDATDNVVSFLDNNFKDDPSIRILKTCSECTATKILILPVMRINREKIMSEGVKLLEQAIVEQIENVSFQICRSPGCNGILSAKHTFGHHLFIELDYLDSDNRRLQEQLTSNKTCEIIKFSDFPLQLKIETNEFSICAVIAQEPGHYIAYCRRKNGMWEKHNDIDTQIKFCKNNQQINPHSVLYLRKQ